MTLAPSELAIARVESVRMRIYDHHLIAELTDAGILDPVCLV